jgi:hypothetical protein
MTKTVIIKPGIKFQLPVNCDPSTITIEAAWPEPGPNIVAAALLWLRNFLDVGGIAIDPKMKERVLKRVDAVLNDQDVMIKDMQAFRAKYPAENIEPEV